MTRRLVGVMSLFAGLVLLMGAERGEQTTASGVEACLSRVLDYDGHLGPWAVIGYRVGERALKESGIPRSSKNLEVIHRCPKAVQYTCMLDGLHASTGASIGKLTLKHEVVPASELQTIVIDHAHAKRYTFTVNPELVSQILNLDHEHQISEARRVAGLPDGQIFRVAVEVEK